MQCKTINTTVMRAHELLEGTSSKENPKVHADWENLLGGYYEIWHEGDGRVSLRQERSRPLKIFCSPSFVKTMQNYGSTIIDLPPTGFPHPIRHLDSCGFAGFKMNQFQNWPESHGDLSFFGCDLSGWNKNSKYADTSSSITFWDCQGVTGDHMVESLMVYLLKDVNVQSFEGLSSGITMIVRADVDFNTMPNVNCHVILKSVNTAYNLRRLLILENVTTEVVNELDTGFMKELKHIFENYSYNQTHDKALVMRGFRKLKDLDNEST